MTTLIALALRLVLLAAFVFGFVVLFEHGPANFGESAKTEWKTFVDFTQKKDEPAPAPVAAPVPEQLATPTPAPPPVAEAPAPAPTPSKPPSAWEALQNRKIGDGMNQPLGDSPDLDGSPTP